MTPAQRLCALLRDPVAASLSWTEHDWSLAWRFARREVLAGVVAARVAPPEIAERVPAALKPAMAATLHVAEVAQRRQRWECSQIINTLAPLGCPVILMKGAAYTALEAPFAIGRQSTDIDIMVPRSWLGAAEQQLHAAGFVTKALDDYDAHYYREWMHELPPIVHAEKGISLDLHHSILPLTARAKPDAKALVLAAVPVRGVAASTFAPADMVVHAAAHSVFDGDFMLALRSLWDIHGLLLHFGDTPEFWPQLRDRAQLHELGPAVALAVRYAQRWFATPIAPEHAQMIAAMLPNALWVATLDAMVESRVFTGDFGRASLRRRTAADLLYMRSHWNRMPPLMLAKHLFTKWRMARRAEKAA
jgi:hypothetical protein